MRSNGQLRPPSLSASLITLVGKESTCNAGDPCSIPGLGRPPGEGIGYPLQCSWASLVAQLVKNLPAMRETWVQSLGWENPLEKGKATHSSILAWRIPLVHGVAKCRTRLSNFHFTFPPSFLHIADPRYWDAVVLLCTCSELGAAWAAPDAEVDRQRSAVTYPRGQEGSHTCSPGEETPLHRGSNWWGSVFSLKIHVILVKFPNNQVLDKLISCGLLSLSGGWGGMSFLKS